MTSGDTPDNKSMNALLSSFNSRARPHQGKTRTNFKVRKGQYLQAKTNKACMYDSSDEDVESSGSDNDEDSNKSTSTYSFEGRHLLTP